MSVTTNLGKVACVGKGEFNASTRYEALDIISYIGSSYLVIAPCSGIYPPNTSYYMLLASKGDTGARGERGQTGATGAKGEKGDTGTGLDIKGTYASLDALSAAVASPEQGDMYFVGTAAPYTVYMWDTTSGTGAWISQGALQGTKGDAGAVFTPNVTAAGVLSWANNGGLTNPSSVNIKGPQGERGDVGIGVPAGGWQGQILSKATDTDYDGVWITIHAADIGAAGLNVDGKVYAEQSNATINEQDAAQDGTYMLALTDAGKCIRMNNSTDATVKVPLESAVAFDVGTEIEIVQYGAGAVTIVAESGVTINSLDGAVALAGQYAVACLKKMAANEWLLGGAIA